MTDVDVLQWRDSRHYYLLMVTAEEGHLEKVKNLIQRGFDVNYEVKNETPASLAFANKHYDVVLALLKANSMFPMNYNHEEASDELKAFVAISTNLHDKIKNENQENLNEILNENPSLRHYYDTNNNSALKIAIITAIFSMVEILLTNNIFLGPHENMEDIVRHLTKNQRRNLRDLHQKLSRHLFSNSLMTLMLNCRFGPDDDGSNSSVYRSLVSRAFHFLLEIPSIAIILKIVAATHYFILYFDFNREWIHYADPSSEPYTEGLFYLSGRIYIGAKNLLDPMRAIETYSIIAHELCHYAMFLVFRNMAKPYRKKDTLGEQEFERINNECKAQKENEKIIDLVYECYPDSHFHAELVVRAPQMIVLYHNQPELLERRAQFPSLMDHFENVLVPALENGLPAVQKKYRKRVEKKVIKQRNFIVFLGILMLCLITGSIFGGYYLFNPTISFEKLTNEQKIKFNNATVNFYGVDVKFCELFNNDSVVYDALSSEHIKDALIGKTDDLSKKIETVYDKFVFLKWSNMTEALQNKTLNSNVSFQGVKVKFHDILPNSSVLELLKVSEIRETLTNNSLNVSEIIKVKDKIYIDRFLMDESTYVKPEMVKNGRINNEHEDVLTFEGVLKTVTHEKIFLLSSFAGEGKSTTFRHFSHKLKEKFPLQWVQFIDLKKHLDALKIGKELTFDEIEEVWKFLVSDLLKLEGLEKEIFVYLFESSNVVFLFDGVDEIAPLYNEFLYELMAKIKTVSENLQFVSTRPQYANEIKENLGIKIHRFIPFESVERVEMLAKFLLVERFKNEIESFKDAINSIYFNSSDFGECFKVQLENFNLTLEEVSDIINEFDRGKVIFDSIESSNDEARLVSNPLLVQMIAEIAVDKHFKVDKDFNFYKLFDIFVDKKIKVTNFKGIRVPKNRFIIIMQIHQAYALQRIFENFLEGKFSELEVMKFITMVSKDEISRYGILYVYSVGDFAFTHRTFAEFFVVRFFIENMDKFDQDKEDTKLRLSMFGAVLFSDDFEFSRNLLFDFLKTDQAFSKLFKLLKEQREKIDKKNLKKEKIQNYFLYVELCRFFREHHNIELADFIPNPSPLTYNDITSVWHEFDTLDVENFLNLLKNKDENDRTLFHQLAQKSTDSLCTQFLNKVKSFMKPHEISSLISTLDSSKQTAFMLSAKYRNKGDLSIIWSFIEDHLIERDRKKLLETINRDSLTALQFSAANPDSESFLFVKNLYEKFMTRNEIQKILSKTQNEKPSFIRDTIKLGSIETSKLVAEYLKKIYEGKNPSLRKVLTVRNSDSGHTIFSEFKEKEEYSEKLGAFKESLQKTFTKNENFDEYFENIEMKE